MAVKRMAVRYFTIPVVTPVPKIFAESLAPKLQPRKIPLMIFHTKFSHHTNMIHSLHAYVDDLEVIACILNDVADGGQAGKKLGQDFTVPKICYLYLS